MALVLVLATRWKMLLQGILSRWRVSRLQSVAMVTTALALPEALSKQLLSLLLVLALELLLQARWLRRGWTC